jgi:hypothetical protein
MTWLLERPLFIVALGLLTAVVLGGVWIQTGRKSVLYALFVALAMTGSLLILERSVQTDREVVESTLYSAARDVQRNDLAAVLQYIHPNAVSIRREAEAEFPRYEFREVRIKPNLEITVFPERSPPEAIARFNVVVDITDRSGFLGDSRVPRYVEVTFRQDGKRWRVVDYHHDDPREGLLLPKQTPNRR